MPIITDPAGGARALVRLLFGSSDDENPTNDTSSTQAQEEIKVEQVRITRETLFDKLWKNYPKVDTAREAYSLVGGQALELHLENPSGYANSCALKFSRSLNYSGITIGKSESGFYTVKGEDNLNYLLRVAEMIRFVEKQFGSPTQVYDASEFTMSEVHSNLMGKTGIIIFDVKGWSDATGHVTLWNGSTCGDHCYFYPNSPARTDRVIFWEID